MPGTGRHIVPPGGWSQCWKIEPQLRALLASLIRPTAHTIASRPASSESLELTASAAEAASSCPVVGQSRPLVPQHWCSSPAHGLDAFSSFGRCRAQLPLLACAGGLLLRRQGERQVINGHQHTCALQVTRAAVQPQGSDAGIRAQVTKRIKTLGESKRPREAVSELAQMARLGVQPDTQAGTALLNACVRNGQIDMAQAVFDELFGEPSELSVEIKMPPSSLRRAAAPL